MRYVVVDWWNQHLASLRRLNILRYGGSFPPQVLGTGQQGSIRLRVPRRDGDPIAVDDLEGRWRIKP